MQRVLTALALLPLVVAGILMLPERWFLLFVLLFVELAALELVNIARSWAPGAPLRLLLLLTPATALALVVSHLEGTSPELARWLPLAIPGVLVLAACCGLLWGKTPVRESLPALGALVFGTLYLAVPATSVWALQRADPWLVILLLAVVTLNDTMAYYGGKTFGRHKMSPLVSPNKTWEGSVCGFLAGVVTTALWSWWRLGEIDSRLLLLGALVAVAGQMGDLLESMLKRGAGVKDSGALLPGHGGVLDRLDALFFAAPVLFLGLHAVRMGHLLE